MKFSRILLALCIATGGWNASAAWSVNEAPAPTPLSRGAALIESAVSRDGATVKIEAVVFNERECTLKLVQNPSPGTGKLAAAMTGSAAIGAVNGGYFQPDYTPVGLRVSDGRVIHPFEHAKLLSGVVAVTGKGIEIVRASSFKISGVREAIQAGPMLVQGGEAIPGLNTVRSARRTIVATNGKGEWALITFTSVTLAGSAEILLTPGILGNWKTAQALNLDGGSSTGLWAETSAGPWSVPEFGSVRDFLTVIKR